MHGAVLRTRLRNAPFAVGVGEARHGGGRDVDGEFDIVADEGRRCVAAGAVDEDAWPQQYASVYAVVEGLALQVVTRGEVVCPGLVWDLLRCHLFNLIEVQQAVQIHRTFILRLARLFWCLLLFREGVCVDGAELIGSFEVLFEDARRVDGIVFFGCVGAGELEDDFGAARVLGDEARYIVNVAVQNYPAAFRCVVLRD